MTSIFLAICPACRYTQKTFRSYYYARCNEIKLTQRRKRRKRGTLLTNPVVGKTGRIITT